MDNRSDYLPHPEGPAAILYRILFGRNRRRNAFVVCGLLVILAVIRDAGSAFEYRTDALAPAYAYAPQSGEAVSQVLPQEKRVLKAVGIRFGTYARTNTGEVVVRFFKNGREIKSWTISSADLIDNAYREFRFDRQVRTEADDTCHFTVTQNYEGLNRVALWMAGALPETAEDDGDEDDQSTEGVVQSVRTQDSVLCYQLTMEDPSLGTAVLLPFVIALLLLLAATALLVSFNRISLLRILAATLFMLVLTGTVATDLFQQIVRDVPVRSFASGSTKVKLAPGETMEEAFEADLCGFSSVEFSVAVTAGRSESVHVRLDNEDLEETYFDGTIQPADMLAGGPGGRRIRISAAQTEAGKLFPKGNYRIYVTNADQEKKLRVCVSEKLLTAEDGGLTGGENTLRNGENGSGEENGSSAENGEDAANAEAEGSGEADAAAEAEQFEIHLNLALQRTSALGYRLACIVLILLGVYVLAVVIVTSRKNVPAERFFIASAVPLGIIYLILMLPWSPPDSGSHILAANRFSNILLRAEKEEQWNVRAMDAGYFPQAWQEGTVAEQHFPCMEEYAGTFLREKDTAGSPGELDDDIEQESKKRTSGSDSISPYESVPYFADVKMEYYSVLNYLPQTIGLTIGKLLKLRSAPAVYLGRILILIAYIIACAHAVRIAPVGKAVFAGIALLPMSLMLSSAYSYDVTVLLSTLCFTAGILRAYHQPADRLLLIECAVWAAVIGGTKGGGYLLLLPLVFLFFSVNTAGLPYGNTPQGAGQLPGSPAGPGRQNGTGQNPGTPAAQSRQGAPVQTAGQQSAGNAAQRRIEDRKYQLRRAALRALPVLAAGILSIILFDVLLPTDSLFQFGEAGTGRMAFSYALVHPMKYLQMLFAAMIQYADSLTINMGGTALAWLERTIPNVFVVGLLLLIAVHALFENDQLEFAGRDKKIFLTVIFLVVLLMPAMLLSWTPIGSRWIEGLQGRYFLPVLPLIYFVLTKFRLHRRTDHSKNNAAIVGRSCMRWFCVFSCICVYYLMRLYLTR